MIRALVALSIIASCALQGHSQQQQQYPGPPQGQLLPNQQMPPQQPQQPPRPDQNKILGSILPNGNQPSAVNPNAAQQPIERNAKDNAEDPDRVKKQNWNYNNNQYGGGGGYNQYNNYPNNNNYPYNNNNQYPNSQWPPYNQQNEIWNPNSATNYFAGNSPYNNPYGNNNNYQYNRPYNNYLSHHVCASYPCLNNGVCVPNSLYVSTNNAQSFTCQCPFSYYGMRCEFRNVDAIIGLVLGIVLPVIGVVTLTILVCVYCCRSKRRLSRK